jgi:hypothetical protein
MSAPYRRRDDMTVAVAPAIKRVLALARRLYGAAHRRRGIPRCREIAATRADERDRVALAKRRQMRLILMTFNSASRRLGV